MCGRYSLFVDTDELASAFGVRVPERFEPRYNAAPGQDLPVIRSDGDDELSDANWGLVPSWADDPADASKPINARSETVRAKPTFRAAFEGDGDDEAVTAGRCLVPADGFYEWVETGSGKQPYRVTMEDDAPFAMAGLFAVWEGVERQPGLDAFAGGSAEPETKRHVSFTVLTTEPNELVADLHHRMAVLLAPEEYETWLHGDADEAETLLDPYPADAMRAYPVSTAVNDPSNDGPSIIEESN
ncbi:SOS response-associated peptidase [Haloarchaeobius iranensis]|uniref:Putative SOS response-associated peptidase YedK n=1 Tax=Haloarchaeobius iranensis TaxID=996166 RepID=A0A1G9VD95_9EURY|nr:SOS response-associated peptidase [Haloarchaeobius iranensis]SDM70172.1 Putative SOS response-associated peptidase YedK [Haloarchaeobius iranensis]